MFAVGLVARAVLIPTEPLWEIDHYRYLWDGGVLSAGLDPYAWSPDAVLAGSAGSDFAALAHASGDVIESANYPQFRTIYPPLAEAAFALAHTMAPWSVIALKILYLASDLAALFLLVRLLRRLNRSPLWAALYWWNPLVIQMTFNAAHMDVLAVPLLLGCVYAATTNRPKTAAVALAAASAVKLWPILLLPALLRFRTTGPRQACRLAGLFVVAAGVLLSPQIALGLGEASGLGAFATGWRRNDALFGVVLMLTSQALDSLGLYDIDAGRLARAMAGGLILLTVAASVRRSAAEPDALIARMMAVPALLLLLGPAAFPWYVIWLFPLAALIPRHWAVPGVLLWTATMPLYHLKFHPLLLDNPTWFSNGVVWLERRANRVSRIGDSLVE